MKHEITAQMIEETLIDLLEDYKEESSEYSSVKSFERAGVLTHDNGLVIKVGNQEFQVTIVQSR